MSHEDDEAPARVRWARMRFAIIGQLLASPPEPGEVGARIAELANTPWRHPTTGDVLHISAKTIERMYYAVRGETDPIRALERKAPKHTGTHPRVAPELGAAIEEQYREHPGWSYQLHYDNLLVVAKDLPAITTMPAYATVRRFMKHHGLYRTKRRRGKGGKDDPTPRETRSYEVAHVNALWHYDFHEGRRTVVTPSGERKKPYLFGLLDDCSRVCCHAQWYLDPENTENLVHGFSQGIQKRGLPRASLSDRGGAMMAAETVGGHENLSIVQYLTMARSPEQNAKQEHFWTRIEGRLMPMLEGEPELTLDLLNTATQAWIEQEYHRTIHGELGKTPLERYLEGPDVGRPSPSSEELRRAFRMEITRTQRGSDGTVTVEGVRFEVPSVYRTLNQLSSELRLLASKDLDSRQLLSVVFAGDARLPERFRTAELLPLGSRIRRRLVLDYASRDELHACLEHLLHVAGNPSLMTAELKATLADHAAGNYRVLMNLADELLVTAADRDLPRLDEKLYFEVFAPPQKSKSPARKR